MPEDVLVFRLLECKRCLRRHWLAGGDPLPLADGGCEHRWWQLYDFRAASNGPGLAPTQLDVPRAER